MKDDIITRNINGRQYIFDNGRWVTIYGIEIDPHDPDYLSFRPLKSNSDD